MPLYRIAGKLVMFIHVPKTGGTTIENVLSSLGPQALFLKQLKPGLEVTPQHFDADLIKKLVPHEFVDFSFLIVRHPVDRLVSEFFYRHTLSCDPHVRTHRLRISRRFSTLDSLEISRYFSKWTRASFKRYLGNPMASDNHFRPQKDFSRMV